MFPDQSSPHDDRTAGDRRCTLPHMPMTVRELVAQPDLRLRTLVSGDLNRTIRWVHATEMAEPGRYMSGSEVILTAGVWYLSGTGPESWVASLMRARAAAVGFGVTPLQPVVPQDLVDACRAVGLTLFQVPIDMAFIAVSEAFIARYVADQQKPLRDTVRRNQELVTAVADGHGLAGVLSVISRYRGQRSYVASRARGVIAWAGQRPDPDTVAAAIQAAEEDLSRSPGHPGRRLPPAGTPGRSAEERGPRQGTGTGRDRPERSSQLSRLVVGAAPGTYLVVERDETPESVEASMIVDQALPYLALELQHAVAARETDRRIAGELFDLVMAGPSMLPAAASRMGTLRLDPAGPLLTIIASASEIETMLDRFEAAIAAESLRGLVVAVKGLEIWALLRWERMDQQIDGLAGRLVKALGPGSSLGVGRPVMGVERLRDSLIVARHACHMARQRRPGGYATHLDVGSHSLLLALADSAARQSFRDAVLQPLVDHDERRGTQLVATLRTFLDSGGEYASTAAALDIHVNTLRLRLSRIEQLTGRDLANPGDRVDFFLALQIDR